MRPIAFVLALVLVVGAFGTMPATAAPDPREMQARQAYAGGNYRDALDLYIKLYAEKLHPIFLRNIGRCYQNLGNADKAIDSFREYLRKAKDIAADERAEVNGYIVEMEELKKKNVRESTATDTDKKPADPSRTGAPVTAAAAEPPHGPTTAPLASASPSPSPATQAAPEPRPAVNLLAAPGSAPSNNEASDEASPLYKRWWFWAIVGGVVASGVGVAAAAGVFTKTTDAPCAVAMCVP